MSVVNYSKYKVVIDPKSKKTQGLSVGDVVRRQYFDYSNIIYSLMLVLDTGVDVYINSEGKEARSNYFIGSLLDGDEPVNGQLLDFVRVTNLFNTSRSGALYLTASESESPYMDVVDGMATENSLCYPYMDGKAVFQADARKYTVYGSSLVSTQYTKSLGDCNRIYRVTRNSVVNSNSYFGIKQLIEKKVKNPQRLIISYKVRSSKSLSNVRVAFGDANRVGNEDAEYRINTTTEWAYIAHVLTADYPESTARQFQFDLTDQISSTGDWFEISDLNIVLLSDIGNFGKSTKTRVGKISGIIDPIFGTIDGYGAYFQNMYASKNVNIAGTLTAGDENGFASTFYVGKIRKNNFINSLTPEFLSANHTISLEQSPVGIGSVYLLQPAMSKLKAQTKDWLHSKIGQKYCFSFWAKKTDTSLVWVSINGVDGESVEIPVANEWVKLSTTLVLSNPLNEQLTIGVNFIGESLLFAAPQLESGERSTMYQPTDASLNDTNDYGAWFNRGGIGGTIQNPLLKLNTDGSISSANGSFVINNDGSGYFADGAIKWNKTKVELGGNVVLTWANLDDETKTNIKGDTGATGAKGDKGSQGVAGEAGQTFYTWVKYSDNPDGTGLYDTPTDSTLYIGIAVNKTTATESLTKTDYSWSKIKGATGSTGATGNKGDKGDNGVDSNLLDWVSDWNSSKTTINSNTVLTPKIFTGVKNANNTITGVALGKFQLITLNSVGAATTENVNGIYGFNAGRRTFSIESDGSVALGRDNDSIKYNPATGRVEFGSNVVLAWQNYTNEQVSGISLGAINYQRDIRIGSEKGNVIVTNLTKRYVTIEFVANSTNIPYMKFNPLAEFTINQLYTLSFWVKPTIKTGDSCDIRFGLRGTGSPDASKIINANEWVRIIQPFTLTQYTSSSRLIVYTPDFAKGVTVDIKDIYLGIGNKVPEDWVEAQSDVLSSIADAQTTANTVTSALGGSIFPKLTYISSTGIYTGTLTAIQVNAVAINASSITTGTLSADRIAANSINGNKIVAGSITADRITTGSITATQINTANLQATLITTGYIEGLSLNFTNGKIGGWSIDTDSIYIGTKGNVVQSYVPYGSMTIGTKGIRSSKWKLDVDGSGALAGDAIKWDSAGNLTFSNAVKINWQNYTDNQISNVQIGGANLLKDTRYNIDSWGGNGIRTNNDYVGLTSVCFARPSSSYADPLAQGGIILKPDTYYTMSMYIKGENNTDIINSYLYPSAMISGINSQGNTTTASDGGINFKVSTEWQRVWVTWKTSGTISGAKNLITNRMQATQGIAGAKVWVCGVKLEEGNKATDWNSRELDVLDNIDNAQSTADNVTTALGGLSFPKLTQISATGIYTGTITAAQVNAVAINASSITTGIMSADRISAGSLNGNKITSGSITATQINTASIQANIVTTGFIQGLSLNFIQGKIGSWAIDSDSIYIGTKTNAHAQFTSASNMMTIGNFGIRGYKWRLDALGSGALAGGAINWDSAGNVYFDETVSLNWTKVAEGMSYQGGKMLNRDPDFRLGLNGVGTYNNSANGNVIVSRVSSPSDCPTTSAYCIEIKNTGTASPALGGFTFSTLSRANAKFITRIIAKIPVGYSLSYAYNSFGIGQSFKFATSNAGTGHYEEYLLIAQCGSSGTFSTINFFYLSGGAVGTTSAPVIWNLASATVYDMSQAEVDYKSLADNAQSTANSSVNALGGSSFPKLTQINSTGIYTGTLTASQITAGTINVARLDAAAIQSGIINTGYIQGLSLSFTKGTIGGWTIGSDSITIGTINGLGAVPIQLRSASSGSATGYWYQGAYKPYGLTMTWYQSNNAGHLVFGQVASSGNGVKSGFYGIQMMSWDNSEYFCLSANALKSGSKEVYNRIAGWAFDHTTISKGNVSLGSDGTIQYSGKWRFANDGAGYIASGNISWDSAGNATIGGNVKISGTAISKAISTDSISVGSNFSVSKDGTLKAVNGEFSGTLSGVTGSFKELKALDSNGTAQGSLTFGSDARLWFNSMDLQHQGTKDSRSLRFYASDMYVRGSFASRQKVTLVVKGAYGYLYSNGLPPSGIYISFSYITYNNTTIYTLPVYGTGNDYSGIPIDLFVISTASTYNYSFEYLNYKHITVVNGYDQNNNIYIWTNNRQVKFVGGAAAEMINVGASNMAPTVSSTAVGLGWVISSMYDNDWS